MRATALALIALGACFAATADETAGKVRAAAGKAQAAVLTLRSVLTVEFQGQQQEHKVETPAVMMGGLLVAPNPEDLVAANLPPGVASTASGFKLVVAEGKEVEAKVVGRDTDFGLLFLKLEGGEAPPALPAARREALQLGDPVVVMSRLSSTHPEILCVESRVCSVIQKPRLMYMVVDLLNPGSVAMTPEGELVGLVATVKEADPDGGRDNVLRVVLPMAQIEEAAKGIRGDGAPKE